MLLSKCAQAITVINLKGGVDKTHITWLLAGNCEEPSVPKTVVTFTMFCFYFDNAHLWGDKWGQSLSKPTKGSRVRMLLQSSNQTIYGI
ncbi:ParA family protein [Gimesia aquarii]|uniref:ParA family protein n=1 Tax=Gimesia aquarii TaxID=2527964 RepID=UPI0011AA24AC|nr:ParA family protein [Gimesia aquarii]